MALISCPECAKEISDKADFCPNCGFSNKQPAPPAAAVRSEEIVNREVFNAAKHSFVLGEITSISRIETRNYVYMVLGIPLLVGNIYLWKTEPSWIMPTVATVLSLVFISLFYKDEGSINSTGTFRELTDDVGKVREQYAEKIGSAALMTYKKNSLIYTTEFTINPARIAGFTTFKGQDHAIPYLIGAVGMGAAYYLNAPVLYAFGLFILLGIFLRKGGIEIDAVGGKKVFIYTLMKDIKPIANELELKISQRADVF